MHGKIGVSSRKKEYSHCAVARLAAALAEGASFSYEDSITEFVRRCKSCLERIHAIQRQDVYKRQGKS